ncbi:MAG: TetR/AcrR family transcriptional regulator, partial [Candidatus Limnocylindrales bacterium]
MENADRSKKSLRVELPPVKVALPPVEVGLPPDATGERPTQVVWIRLASASARTRREVDRIVAAAIGLADREGLEALSMRRLAAALDTGTTTLYRHIANRDELLELMVDAVAGEDPLPEAPSGNPSADLALIARGARQSCHRHPWLVTQFASRPTIGPNTLRGADFAFAVVSGLTSDIDVAASMVASILYFVRGAVTDELAEDAAARRTGLTEEQWRAQMRPYVRSIIESGAYPH